MFLLLAHSPHTWNFRQIVTRVIPKSASLLIPALQGLYQKVTFWDGKKNQDGGENARGSRGVFLSLKPLSDQ